MQPFTLRDYVTLYIARFKVEIAGMLAYRGAIAIWTLGLIFQPLVALVVWTTVAKSQGGSAGGFSASEYAAYFIVLMVVNHLTFIWQAWEQEWRIRTGWYSPILLRPVHPIHQDVTTNLSFKLIGLVAVIPAAIILSFAFDAKYADTSVLDILVFIPALILAMTLRFIFEWTLGLIAFWMTKSSALLQLFGTLSLFLAGQIAPLALFPEPVRILASILPFRWMLSFPVEVFLGQRSGVDMLIGLGLQLLWIGLSLLALRYLWSRAVARYSAVGA
jgi:ABC-2 type transport system permease protein